jgi:uncharacterized protein (DUF1015 family)
VDDAEALGALVRAMRPLKLYIADGHHRYETMLALRERFRERAGGQLSSRSAAGFGTMFLSNMDDPGLIVLPTHRLVHGLEGFSLERTIEQARQWFDVDMVADAGRDPVALRALLAERGKRAPTFGAIIPDSTTATVLSLKPGFDPGAAGIGADPALTSLDVTLLHSLILERILGIDRAAQEAQTNLAYIKDTAKAVDQTASGAGQICFVMNPTRLEQVRAVADAGEVMPQKSTFFYPKIASGIVINKIDPAEEL